MATNDRARRVLLNATRSEAEELLQHESPPRPSSLKDSAGDQDDLYASRVHELEVHEPKGYLEHEMEKHGRKPDLKLWAPPSRGGAGGAAPNGTSSQAGHQEPSSDLSASPVAAAAAPAVAPATPAPKPQATATVEGRVRPSHEAIAELREVDVRAAFAGLPRIKPHWTHRYMKILLVGESGLGKTTFVRNLFAAYARDASFPVNDASIANAQRIFMDNPEALCTEIVLQDSENKVYYHYLVQDTPGYGDSTDLAADRQVILDYIQDCSAAYLEQEMDPERKAAMHAIRDTRVDVCLYFIPPHRLRQIDLAFMSELAAVAPVVPVLAKADTMTAEELKEFRHRVRETLRRANVRSPFSHDSLEEAGARHGPPFAIIGSNQMDLAVGKFWPVRKYPWGSVEAMLTQHSELPVLRRLLFETGYMELKDGTEKRFHEYRRQHCAGGKPRGIVGAFNRVARNLALGGGLVFAFWLLAGGGAAVIKDEAKRKETVRRVKEKVGEVVEQAAEVAHDVGGKAHEAATIAKSTTSAAADVTKRAVTDVADKASRALETEEQRKRREAEERKARGWG